jgi:hypothetical protein
MGTHRADLTVYAKDYPETRLIVEVKRGTFSPSKNDGTFRQVAQHMWGANCHIGLIVTPVSTYVLRDDFTNPGPESIRVAAVLPSATVFSRVGWPLSEANGELQIERRVHEWLKRLSDSYETALPDDPAVMSAFFPEIVNAVSDGRVIGEVAA